MYVWTPGDRQIISDLGLPLQVATIVIEEADAVAHPIYLRRLLVERTPQRQYSWVRHAIYWRCRKLSTPQGEPYSYPRIGNMFGLDHTSILHGDRAHERRRHHDYLPLRPDPERALRGAEACLAATLGRRPERQPADADGPGVGERQPGAAA